MGKATKGRKEMRLYELTSQFKELQNLEDIDPVALGDTIDSIKGDISEKGRGVASYFQNLDADIAAMKEAEKRIASRRKAIEKNSAYLKEYLLRNMQECDITSIECPEFKVTIRKPSKVVNVYNEGAVLNQFKTTKTVITVNKNEIKKYMKENDFDAMEGVELIDGNSSLIIK